MAEIVKSSTACYLTTCGLLVGTLAGCVAVGSRPADNLAKPLAGIGREIAGWSAVRENPLSERVLDRLQPTSILARTYQRDGVQLDLFIAFYGRQRAGEAIHTPRRCLPGAGWFVAATGTAGVPAGDHALEVNRFKIEKGADSAIVLYWYQTRDRVIASEYSGKLLLIRDTLAGGHPGGSIVRLILPDRPGAAEAGIRFASELIPQVHRCLTEF